MAVLKSAQFKPMVKDAVVLDLGDIAAQADRIIAVAEQRARRIEADARLRGESAAQEAAQQACEKAHAQGLAAGMHEGCASGREQAFTDMSERLGALEGTLVEVAQRLESTQAALNREARHAVLELSMRLAERIVHRAIEIDRSVVVDQVGAALSHVLGQYDVTLLLHPDDAELVAQAMPKFSDQMPSLTHIRLVKDDSIAVGGCVVRYGQGEIDATIDTQLKRIVELLMPVDESAPDGKS